jgi:hypothetical protein
MVALPVSSATSMAIAQSSLASSTSGVTASQLQEAWELYHENLSTVGPVPAGALPVLMNYNETAQSMQVPTNQSASISPDIVDPVLSTYYIAAYGYSGSTWHDAHAETTTITFSGSPSALESNTVSGGLNVHVPDTTYAVDYLLMFSVYYTSNGEANVAYAVYSACAGSSYGSCGPQYPNNPVADYLITSGSVADVGKAGDHINLVMYWDTNNGLYGYVFDYADLNVSTTDWTVLYLNPTGNYTTMQSESLGWGTVSAIGNSPYNAYFYQIGFSLSGIPQNSNWEVKALGSTYQQSNTTTVTYADHATTLTWVSSPSYFYFSYWKEIWVVSGTPAQPYGIYIGGSGSSSSNQVYIGYNGGAQQGDVSLW